MLDKRQIANVELEETLNSGILSFVEPQSQSFAELPDAPQTENDASNGNVVNNFNVSVNVNGGGDSRTIQNITTTSLQNALPNMNESSNEIKKNSSIDFQGIYGQDSNALNITQEPDILNNLYSIYQSNDQSPSDLIYSNISHFQKAEISHYSYSESSLKTDNQNTKNQYEVLKNIIYYPSQGDDYNEKMPSDYSITTDVSNISPQTNNYNIQNTSSYGGYALQNFNNLNIENTSNSNIEAIMELSRKKDRVQAQELQNVNKTVRNIEDLGKLNQNEMDDVTEATTVERKYGAGPSVNRSHDGRKASHINSPLNNTPKFIEKMNRPPIWRSVLG